MTRLGILSVRAEKAGLWQKLRFPIKIKERLQSPFETVTAEMAFTSEELKKLPGWILRLLQKKGRRFLKKQGAEAIVMTVECAEGFSVPCQGGNSFQMRLTSERMADCLELACSHLQKNPSGITAWFLDRSGQALTFSMLAKVCTRVQYIHIATKNPQRIEKICERLFEEYGVDPEINCSCRNPLPDDNTLIVDLDLREIRVGHSFLVDGMQVSLDLCGYHLDAKTLISEFPEFASALRFVSWTSGKKRLTR